MAQRLYKSKKSATFVRLKYGRLTLCAREREANGELGKDFTILGYGDKKGR